MVQLILAYAIGVIVGGFLGAIIYAFLVETADSLSPADYQNEDGVGATDYADATTDSGGAGPFVLCSACGRISDRDEQIRLCPTCAPSTGAIDDPVIERE